MNEFIRALACGAVKITPATFSWELAGGKSCEAHLLSGTVKELQYPVGIDTYVDLLIALPAMESNVLFKMCHTGEEDGSFSAFIDMNKVNGSCLTDLDTHYKNIEAILRIIKIPLRQIRVWAEESHTSDDNFGFSWRLASEE